MKTFTLVLVILGTLGEVLNAPSEQPNSNTNLVDLNIVSANLKREASSFIKAWVINTNNGALLTRPIDQSKLTDITFQVLSTRGDSQPNTKTPVYNLAFGIPTGEFNEKSTVVVEIWNSNDGTFIGRSIFTIGALQTQPQKKFLDYIVQKSDFDTLGRLNVTWEQGNL